VTLSWKKPSNDGGSKIIGYVVEKKPKDGKKFEPCNARPCPEPTYTVTGLKEGEEYEFRVVAVNEIGESPPSKACPLVKVEEQPDKPRIDANAVKDITVKAGEEFQIVVPFTGFPKPEATWTLNDKPISPNDKHFASKVDEDKAVLTCPSAARGDTGPYTVMLKNPSGFDTIKCNVTVLDRPSPPSDVKAEDVDASSLTLKWSPPKDDGGAEITNYVVEKREPGQEWTKVNSFVTKPELKVRNLITGKKYEFRVMAENQNGRSDPAQTDSPVLVKNPYDKAKAPSDIEIEDYSENHVDLKWKPPLDDGGAPITGYIIEKKEKFGNWEPCLKTDNAATKAKVEGLTKGKEYQFRVKAVNKAGPGEPSAPTKPHVAKEKFLAPKINRDTLHPVTVRAGNMARLEVEAAGEPPPTITWSFAGKPLESANDCKIENEDYKSNFQLRHTTRAQSGMYKITATNPYGTDEAEVQINVLDKPSKPEGPLEVNDVKPDSCTLSWRAPKDDGGLPIEQYVVEQQDTETGIWTPVTRVSGNKTECTVSNLEPGKRYNFRVKAVNEEGNSEPLETEKPVLVKKPFDAPGAPGAPAITDYDRDFVQLEWDAPLRDGGAPITGYIIEMKDKYSPNWVKAAEVPADACQGKVKGLIEGEKYEFRVKAVNKAGPGAASESSGLHTAKPKSVKPQIDRTNLIPTKVKVGHMVNFDVKVTGEPPPKIVWTLNGKEIGTGPAYQISNEDHRTNFTLVKASRKESGVYKITATNSAGSDEAEVEIEVHGPPSTPNGPLEVSDVHKDGCTLKWNEPDDDGGSPIEGYEIEKLDEETGRWMPCGKATKPCFEVKNLTPDHKYKFRVRAVNKDGQSDDLETDRAIVAKNPFDTPDAPGQPKATDWGPTFAQLEWTPPLIDGGKPVTGYIIEKREVGQPDWTKATAAPVTNTNFTVNNLIEGKTYEFRVSAVNEGGVGKPSKASAPVKAEKRKFAPGAPDMPRPEKITKDSVTLSWKKPSNDGGSKIIGYVVEKKPKDGKKFEPCNARPCPEPTYTVTGLKEGEEYEFRVVAVNEIGESPPSKACPLVKVEEQPDKPRIDANAVKDITVKAGEEFQIVVPFTGFPKPEATWTLNDKPISPNDKHFASKVDEDKAVLTCPSAARGDT
ncbi:twitchin-like protein, partial [Dinothrombium tinctorium]